MRRLVIPRKVQNELLSAIAWSKEHHGTDIAEKLLRTVQSALLEIAERPMMWPVMKSDPHIRNRHLLAIHYTLTYRVTSAMVRIVAFRHMHRKPEARTPRR